MFKITVELSGQKLAEVELMGGLKVVINPDVHMSLDDIIKLILEQLNKK